MVASRKTIDEAAGVVLRHLPKSGALALIRELRAVPGNASFAATLAAIEVELVAASDPLLPDGVVDVVDCPVNQVMEHWEATDLDRVNDFLIRADTLAEAAARAAELATLNPGNTVRLMGVIAAYKKPRDHHCTMRYPVVERYGRRHVERYDVPHVEEI